MNLQKRLNKHKKDIGELQKKLLEDSKLFFKEASQDLFKENPTLKSFGWRQYTPYWNDGDECIFGTSTDYPIINEYDSDYGQYEGGENLSKGQLKELEDQHEKLAPIVTEFLNSFYKDVLKTMFGDHVTVRVNPKGVEVEEYDHD